jgi:hypothetical protein
MTTKIFAVALLLMSFASVAFADGGGLPPVKGGIVTSTDGSGPRPPATTTFADGGGLPPKGTTTKPAVLLADGGGLPPKGTTTKPAVVPFADWGVATN